MVGCISKYYRIWLPLVLFLFVIVGKEAQATIYVCKDAKGVVQFTNAPSASDCQVYTKKSKNSVRGSVSKSKRRTNPNKYDSYINSAGARFQIDPFLIKAVIHVESDFDRYAVSKVGAQGLMQLMPGTAKELKVHDPFNAMENIHGGTRYLRMLFNMFDGDLKLTLAAYNAGPTIVKKVKRVPKIPETVNYVHKVLTHYKRYRGGLGYPEKSSIKVGGLRVAATR